MSDWRSKAKEIIEKTLAALPDDAPPQQVRKALLAAYPWGERKNHPYTCWLEERKLALKRRGQKGKDGVPTVAFLMRFKGQLPWLYVSCGWCNVSAPGGCLQCVRQKFLLAEIIKDKQFLSLRDAIKEDEGARGVLGDWLEEHLGTRAGL